MARPLGSPREIPAAFREAFMAERELRDAYDAHALALAVHEADEADRTTTYGPAPRRPRMSWGRRIVWALAVFVGLGILGNIMGPPKGADATPVVPTTHSTPATVTVTAPPTTVHVVTTAQDAPMFNPDAHLDDSQTTHAQPGDPAPTTVEFTPETTAMVMPAPTATGPDGDPAPAPVDTDPSPELSAPVSAPTTTAPVSVARPADAVCWAAAQDVVADGWTGTPDQTACYSGPDDPRIADDYAASEYQGYTPGTSSYFPPGDPRNDVIDAAYRAGASATQVVDIVTVLSR